VGKPGRKVAQKRWLENGIFEQLHKDIILIEHSNYTKNLN
jgi:hypothetical protein